MIEVMANTRGYAITYSVNTVNTSYTDCHCIAKPQTFALRFKSKQILIIVIKIAKIIATFTDQ